MCKPVEDETDARGCKAKEGGQRCTQTGEGRSNPRRGVCKVGERAFISRKGRSCEITQESCKPPRVLADPGGPSREERRQRGAALGVGVQTMAGQGKAGRAGRGWGGTASSLAQPRWVCKREARGTMPGTPAGG